MNLAAVYHRPDSEFAYLYEKGLMHIRLRTAKGDVKSVHIIKGDPYFIHSDKWFNEETAMRKIASTDLFDYWLIESTAPHNRLQYAFHLEGNEGEHHYYCDQGVFPYEKEIVSNPNYYFRMPYFQEIDRCKTPDWVKETVWYQVFPERFENGNKENDPKGTLPWGSKSPGREDFFGGDLQGITNNLDYLEDLGINGLYLCPIFKAKSNHKYDTIDYFEIDPDFGTKEDFKNLVEEAHKRGIKIMLDAVFNHMGDTSPEWQDVIEKGENSPYADWFHIKEFPVSYKQKQGSDYDFETTYETFSQTPHMPKLNTANPEVIEYLLEIGTYWIKEFDIDAWRLDVANEVDHQFWKKFYHNCMNLKDDFYILGEIWHSSQSWLQGDEFHGVMSYAYTEMISDFFIKEKLTASKMIAGLNNQRMMYRDQINQVMFNLLDSHDTARILTMCGGDKELVKIALAFMFTQTGSPCLYYGTEIGMAGENDPGCRGCMEWDTDKWDQDMVEFTKELIKFRRDYHNLLSYGTLDFIIGDDAHTFVGFKRETETQILTAYFNRGTETQKIDVNTGQEIVMSCLANSELGTIEEKGFIFLIETK